ncbi:MAG: preprotein translocase subunit SecE [Candidatus Paceibacterota bacterium]
MHRIIIEYFAGFSDTISVMQNEQISPGSFISQVKAEIAKVTWPTHQQTIRLTVTVFIISLIVAIYVGIIDVLMAKVLDTLTRLR